MSIASTIKKAIGPDPESAALVKDIAATEAIKAGVAEKRQALQVSISTKTASLNQAALDSFGAANPKENKYADLNATIAAEQEQLAHLGRVDQGADEKIAALKAALHLLGKKQLLREQKRINDKKASAAEKVQKAIDDLAAGYLEYREHAEANLAQWTFKPIAGAVLYPREIADAIATALARAYPVDTLNRIKDVPLPGAAFNELVGQGNPTKLPTFIEQVADANTWLAQITERGFA